MLPIQADTKETDSSASCCANPQNFSLRQKRFPWRTVHCLAAFATCFGHSFTRATSLSGSGWSQLQGRCWGNTAPVPAPVSPSFPPTTTTRSGDLSLEPSNLAGGSEISLGGHVSPAAPHGLRSLTCRELC